MSFVVHIHNSANVPSRSSAPSGSRSKMSVSGTVWIGIAAYIQAVQVLLTTQSTLLSHTFRGVTYPGNTVVKRESKSGSIEGRVIALMTGTNHQGRRFKLSLSASREWGALTEGKEFERCQGVLEPTVRIYPGYYTPLITIMVLFNNTACLIKVWGFCIWIRKYDSCVRTLKNESFYTISKSNVSYFFVSTLFYFLFKFIV